MPRVPNIYYRNSSADRPPLRIGLLLDLHSRDSKDQIPAFAAAVIEDLLASNFAKIELLVVTKPADGQVHSLLYDLYLRLDARMKPANDPLAKIDARELLSGIETIHLASSSFPAETVAQIRSKNLDVLIQLGSAKLTEEILRSAQFGVWSYTFSDSEFYRGELSHFWELYEGSPLSGVELRASHAGREQDTVLAKALFTTERTLSVSRNRYAPYWGSTDLLIAKLNQLHRFGWDHVLEQTIPPAPYRGKRKIYRTPTNIDILPWLAPIFIKKALSYPFRRELAQHWRIAIRVGATPLYEASNALSVSGFRWIEAPPGRAWADPFVFEDEGKFWAFFEDYSYREKRAGLACALISADGSFGTPTACLYHPNHHYSYPHVFRDRDQIFMIPESFDSNSVDLYRCTKFPNEWASEKTLFEGKFVDTTVWQHEGLWWLATTTADPGPGAGSLLLFFSESITGKWHFHPANPISTDIRRNRGAGYIIRDGARLLRPSQSCAPTYGYSFAFNEITELSTERYAERLLTTIDPHLWPGIAGVHTYNRGGKIELIDGREPRSLQRLLHSRP